MNITRTKDEWVSLLKESRNNIVYKQVIDFSWLETKGRHLDSFITDMLIQFDIMDEKGIASFVEKLNQNQLKDYSAENIYKKWNSSKSPVRNWLLVRYIDYPTQVELEHRKLEQGQ